MPENDSRRAKVRGTITYKASVEKDFRKIGAPSASRVLAKIERSLRDLGHQGEALSGEFQGLYKLRAGDYRVIFMPTRDGYLVLRVGHRREVYKKGRPA